MTAVTIRTATSADTATLSRLGRDTFLETFVEGFKVPYSSEDLAEFMPEAYGEDVIARYQADPRFVHFIAERDGQPVGYALVGPNGLPHADARPDDGELKRIYLLPTAQGTGAGLALHRAAIAALETLGHAVIWLGVWSGNLRAQRFYEKDGFRKVGEYRFKVGSTLDHEYIMRRG
jgi:ribosomal protein S18 acetylase RimI-like enzyme